MPYISRNSARRSIFLFTRLLSYLNSLRLSQDAGNSKHATISQLNFFLCREPFAAEPLLFTVLLIPRFCICSSALRVTNKARIRTTIPGVCLVFIWCLLQFVDTNSYSQIRRKNGLNTDYNKSHLQRQTHINAIGRHSKTACRGFKSFCPCQIRTQEMIQFLSPIFRINKPFLGI